MTAQNFIDSNKRWAHFETMVCPMVTVIYKLDGDTIIDNKMYIKIMSTLDSLELPSAEWYTVGALREENGRVYKKVDNNNEILLYDFNVLPGDSVQGRGHDPAFPTTIFVDFVDSVALLDHTKRKRIIFKPQYSWVDPEIWIEGIGSINGLYLGPTVGGPGDLVCYFENGSNLFKNYSYSHCYPYFSGIKSISDNLILRHQPVKDKLVINVREKGLVQIYDLSGKLIWKQAISGENTIDVSNFIDGLYFLQYQDGQESINTKFIIQK